VAGPHVSHRKFIRRQEFYNMRIDFGCRLDRGAVRDEAALAELV